METWVFRPIPKINLTVIELPIRDGNNTTNTSSYIFSYVIELPIRDGNTHQHRPRSQVIHVIELPIRDGNNKTCYNGMFRVNCY